MKHVVLYSGGHSSAIVAIEVVRKYGRENVILLNHDISSTVEDEDIKRFKDEISSYLGIDVTYANHERWKDATPISVCLDARAWKVGSGQILCTNRLKTGPFDLWLERNDSQKENIYYYGFDRNEMHRVQRRVGVMAERGYKTDYPIALWPQRTIHSTEEIGINRPMAYSRFKHANCIGCLKAGWQHWYCVYVLRKDIWNEAKAAEEEIGYAIHKDEAGAVYLEEREGLFAEMERLGIQQMNTSHLENSGVLLSKQLLSELCK
ncbi:hypothetical protein PO457_05835 [Escherichia coli]